MRTISPVGLASQHAERTGEVWATLLTVNHPALATPIRITDNNEQIVSLGQTYIALPFELSVPGSDPDQQAMATVKVDNVDRVLMDTLRIMATPPTVDIVVIMCSQPDTIEASWRGLTLRNANYDAGTISGDLNFESILAEPCCLTMTPGQFPGLF